MSTKMTPTMADKAYAAGLIDGEGCIDCIARHGVKGAVNTQYVLRVHINITRRCVLDYLHFLWGGTITNRKPAKKHWSRQYAWMLTGNSAMDFLNDIRPYLILKRAEADVALKFRIKAVHTRSTALNPRQMQLRKYIKHELHRLKTVA